MNERIQIINDTAFIQAHNGNDWRIKEYADGEVGIRCEHRDDSECASLFLNQTELKQLIEFLQSKVK